MCIFLLTEMQQRWWRWMQFAGSGSAACYNIFLKYRSYSTFLRVSPSGRRSLRAVSSTEVSFTFPDWVLSLGRGVFSYFGTKLYNKNSLALKRKEKKRKVLVKNQGVVLPFINVLDNFFDTLFIILLNIVYLLLTFCLYESFSEK